MDVNPGYSCTNAGGEMTTEPIHAFMKFTVDSMQNKLWRSFNTGWRRFLMMMKSAPANEGVSDFVRNAGVQITEANIQ